MDDLPGTQTQEDYIESSQDSAEIRKPWGRLCACMPTLLSKDLFDENYVFGRAPNCNIVVDKTQFPCILNVSKEHFRLTKGEDDVIYITDLSKNGTFINDTKIGKNNKLIVYNRDIIAVGCPSARIYSFFCDVNRDDGDYPDEIRKKYHISKKLGRGAFGEVRLIHHKRNFEKFAIKKIHKGCSSSSAGNRSDKVRNEIEILTTLSHAFIIQMIEVFETEKDVFLVLEYMSGGELTSRILSAQPFPESEVKFIFYQILLALRYLHLNGVTHRDLKPENVLMVTNDLYPMVKVSDFGLSKITDGVSLMETVCGTIAYAAPEVLKCYERYNKNVDIWSLGVILFYMLSKTQPFTGGDRETVARNILSGRINWDISKLWKIVTLPAKDLTRRMLTRDPELRIPIAEIFNHEWISKDFTMKYKVEELMAGSDSSETFIPVPKRLKLSEDSS